MSPNAFDQKSLIDHVFSEQNENSINYATTKRNYTGHIIAAIIAGSMLLSATYENFRPIKTGEIKEVILSNTKNSQIIIENNKTNTLDTLILNTAPTNEFKFVFDSPKDYTGQANALENELKPGSILEARVYSNKNNTVYELMNVKLDTSYKKQSNLQTASFN